MKITEEPRLPDFEPSRDANEPQTEQKENQEAEPLNAKYAAKLLFFSFKFSQGSANLQKNIFGYLHILRPEWRISENIKEDIVKKVNKATQNLILKKRSFEEFAGKHHTTLSASATGENEYSKPKKITPEIIENNIRNELENMKNCFEYPRPENTKILFEELINRLVNRDYNYLVFTKGRPRALAGGDIGPATDPFLSHFCHYGLLGHSTGIKEYDQMFRDIVDYTHKHLTDNKRLSEVISMWNIHHPESPVSLDKPNITQ